ncbi:MAG: hypothetical protein JNK32_04645 [Anaerolineales bacterium]|nr:hypothetical protein [Anaerolineales bacterium]
MTKKAKAKNETGAAREPVEVRIARIGMISAIITGVIALFGVIYATTFPFVFNNKNEEPAYPTNAPTIIPAIGSSALNDSYTLAAFYIEVNGKQERVEPEGTISVSQNSVLIIEPMPQPPGGMALKWVSCSGAALVELSGNKASYLAQAAGADCVRLIVEADSGVILDDASFSLTIQ